MSLSHREVLPTTVFSSNRRTTVPAFPRLPFVITPLHPQLASARRHKSLSEMSVRPATSQGGSSSESASSWGAMLRAIEGEKRRPAFDTCEALKMQPTKVSLWDRKVAERGERFFVCISA